jgi:hypothetical protein
MPRRLGTSVRWWIKWISIGWDIRHTQASVCKTVLSGKSDGKGEGNLGRYLVARRALSFFTSRFVTCLAGWRRARVCVCVCYFMFIGP